jgi:hypothetical protein
MCVEQYDPALRVLDLRVRVEKVQRILATGNDLVYLLSLG